MSDNKTFIDTNVFVYLYSGNSDDNEKRFRAYEVIKRYDCQISTQVLNEFCNICIKKINLTSKTIQNLINQICIYCDLAFIDEHTIFKALEIYKKYGYSYYDSLIVASALECGCTYLFSEDMADRQIIEKSLTIRNFFIEV